jgi:glutaconate CoA-transferase subunit A
VSASKVSGLAEAVGAHAAPGTTVYLGNFGAQLFCVGHEMIRQGVRGLDAVIASGGLLMDQLLGAGVLASVSYGHCWSPVGPSPAWNFRRAAERGDTSVRLHEMSLGMLTAALTAGAWGVPFMPVPSLAGTGYLTEDWPRGRRARVATPYGESDVVAAIAPDVAFVHADLADADGNASIRGPLGEVLVAAQAARTVVVIAEETVAAERVRAAGVSIPGMLVSAVVEQPGAVRPDGAIGRYDRDVAGYADYVARAATPDGFAAWVEEIRGLAVAGGAR